MQNWTIREIGRSYRQKQGGLFNLNNAFVDGRPLWLTTVHFRVIVHLHPLGLSTLHFTLFSCR